MITYLYHRIHFRRIEPIHQKYEKKLNIHYFSRRKVITIISNVVMI